MDLTAVDFALAAFREEGVWQLQDVVPTALASSTELADALRRLPGDGGALGLVAVDEDFFLLVRVAGPLTRMLLSDITAGDEWELARSALEFLGLPHTEHDEDEEQVPAGDLDIVGDLGMNAMDMGVLLDDFDLYPDEMLSEVARRLGFGPLFDARVGLASA
ncbi:MAG: tRNA adenosine deaminase-associated protein [Nocardioides sp.]